jgi:hypothetical protein
MTGCVRFPLSAVLLAVVFALAGCSASHKSDPIEPNSTELLGLSPPFYNSDVQAMCDPPVGWKPQPLKASENHTDQVWLSSTGDTAYGVIHFKMPLPVGSGLAFLGFLNQMKKIQGEATLLDRHDDPNLPGIRFVAQGGRYCLRANLQVAGWDGWTVYAGTLKSGPILPKELDLAIRAREHTRVGRLQVSGH